jgi:hypothetical protein
MKFEELPKEVLNHCHRISGALNAPPLNEFQNVEHFLNEIQSRISQLKSLSLSMYKIIGGDLIKS